MKKLRWAIDGELWELDASTPRTLEGAARAVPGKALPLGLSRGTKLFRPNQIDFMQRFMAAPFLPSYTHHLGVTIQRVLSIPVSENWSALLLGQFNLRKFLSSLKENGGGDGVRKRDLKSIGKLFLDKSLYALGFSSEVLLTPDDTLLLSSDSYYAHNSSSIPRKKAVFHHKAADEPPTILGIIPGHARDSNPTKSEDTLVPLVGVLSCAHKWPIALRHSPFVNHTQHFVEAGDKTPAQHRDNIFYCWGSSCPMDDTSKIFPEGVGPLNNSFTTEVHIGTLGLSLSNGPCSKGSEVLLLSSAKGQGFPHHNLTVDAAWPALFVDKETGTYWDVPFSMAIDLASLPLDSGLSYHLCLHHNHGSPKQFQGDPIAQVPASLFAGVSAKCAFSYEKNVDIWRSKAQKLKMVQPYDIFLSDPHVSASGTIGAALSANFGESSVRLVEDAEDIKHLSYHNPTLNSTLLGDIFASVSFTAQHGNFQRLVSDLTRFHVRMDFPSGSKFLSGATRLAQDLLNSHQPSPEAVKMICPTTSLSLQQQIAGPFSFRVDSGVVVDFKDKGWHIQADQPVFAIEYALQVLCSAKAVAWYSPKHQEFMVELRFFES
ncbi:hypothetical protein CXB51_015428 [Gossypium anomalum]|uniref:Protein TRIGALACTOSYLDIACYLGLYCEROL 4, chloroplastic n=1 Tax=Gossypium anomalum TaxID=47600 RepID=A0A8J5YZK9_9ROSI|nr:hypothetical protein CXB51_015428 [Gossypium anomalum]